MLNALPAGWNTGFILAAYCFCFGFRAIWTFASSYVINRLRRQKIDFKVCQHSCACGSLETVILGVEALCLLSNDPIAVQDQFIIAYGGLRGAIAFALAFILLEPHVLCVDGFDGNGTGAGFCSTGKHAAGVVQEGEC